MKLLNVGCGGQRPQDEHWWNTDNLREQLAIGTPERANLDAEPRYVECNMLTHPLPFDDEFFDGILLQHVLEHFDCHGAVDVLMKCRRVLKPGGFIVVSVPDAEYFLEVYRDDDRDRAVSLFGEPIHDVGFEKFFDYALWRYDHKQIFTVGSMLATLIRAGFDFDNVHLGLGNHGEIIPEVIREMEKQLSRRKFSLEMRAIKSA
jgi:predicted SAM-dependent methyltransferase